MKVENLAKNREKGQNCYPLSPGIHRAVHRDVSTAYDERARGGVSVRAQVVVQEDAIRNADGVEVREQRTLEESVPHLARRPRCVRDHVRDDAADVDRECDGVLLTLNPKPYFTTTGSSSSSSSSYAATIKRARHS